MSTFSYDVQRAHSPAHSDSDRGESPLSLLAQVAESTKKALPSISELFKGNPAGDCLPSPPLSASTGSISLPSIHTLPIMRVLTPMPATPITPRFNSTPSLQQRVVPSSPTTQRFMIASSQLPMRRHSYNDFSDHQRSNRYSPLTPIPPPRTPSPISSESTQQQQTSDTSSTGGVRASKQQVQELLKIFSTTPTPSGIMHHAISENLGMSRKAVRNWFQNQRAKIRRLSIQDCNAYSEELQTPIAEVVRRMSHPQVTFMSLIEKGSLLPVVSPMTPTASSS